MISINKIISFLTAIVATSSIILLFNNNVSLAADSFLDTHNLITGNVDVSAFDGINIEINDEAIYLETTDNTLSFYTNDDFSLNYIDNGYTFVPDKNGKYIVNVSSLLSLSQFLFCTYYIEVNDFTVNIQCGDRFLVEQAADFKLNACVITPQNEKCIIESISLAEIPALISYNVKALLDSDYWFAYNASPQLGKLCSTLYLTSNKDDFITIKTPYVAVSEYIYPLIKLGEKVVSKPYKLFTIDCSNTVEVPQVFDVDITQIKGYNTNYFNYSVKDKFILSSTLKIEDGIKNDLNLDRQFNIADLVMLQKQLLGTNSNAQCNWRASDISQNGVVDVFDLVLMRKALIEYEMFFEN